MPDRWAGSSDFSWTRACVHEAHQGCAHLLALGGGFNPRRLRLEFGAGLCRCSCHSSCPVTITTKRLTVPAKTWYTSCTCPGADDERERLDDAGIEFPDFAELREKAKRRSRAGHEAYEAARARSAGKTRDEIRDIYLSELNARGMKKPAEPILDAVVERIAGNPLPAVRLLGEIVGQIGKGLYDLSRLFRQRN